MLVRILMFFLILWLFAVGAIWFAIRQIKSWLSGTRTGTQRSSGASHSSMHNDQHDNQAKQQKPLAAQLVKCAKCESYVPVEQAILNNNCYYCDPPCD